MKALVVYESLFGNTEQVAQARHGASDWGIRAAEHDLESAGVLIL
jgi:flavodoxin